MPFDREKELFPHDYNDDEIYTAVLTMTYMSSKDGSALSRRMFIDGLSPSLIQKLPEMEYLDSVLWHACNNNDISPGSQYFDPASNWYRITDRGIFNFRKYLEPLYNSIQDEQKVNQIIDNNVKDNKNRKILKNFFKKNKGLSSEEFEGRMQELVFSIGKEGILILVKLIINATLSIQSP